MVRCNLRRLQLKAVHQMCLAVSRVLPFWRGRNRQLSELASWLLPTLNEPSFCPTIYGFDLCLGRHGGHWLYYLGFYETGTQQVLRMCLRPGDVLVDAGSSVGLMTHIGSFAVGKTGTVLSFEPDARRFRCLQRGLRLNRCTNVKSFSVALGDRHTRMALYIDRPSPSLVPDGSEGRHDSVDVKPLDAVLADLGVSDVRFMKIDVEGYECEVLRGSEALLSGPRPPILCFERNSKLPRSNSVDPVEFVLAQNRYQLFQLERTSHTAGRLKEVSVLSELEPDDNVYCMTQEHRLTIPPALFKTSRL